MDYYPKNSLDSFEKKYKLGVAFVRSTPTSLNFASYTIDPKYEVKKDFTQMYVVLSYKKRVWMKVNGAPGKWYLFEVRFTSTILSDSSSIPKSEVDKIYVWSIKWHEYSAVSDGEPRSL